MPRVSRIVAVGLAAASLACAAPLTSSPSGLFRRDWCFFSCPVADLIPVLLPPAGFSRDQCPAIPTEDHLDPGLEEIQSTPLKERSLAAPPPSLNISPAALTPRGQIQLCTEVAAFTFTALAGWAGRTKRMTLVGGKNYILKVAANIAIHSIVRYYPTVGSDVGDMSVATEYYDRGQQSVVMTFTQEQTIGGARFAVNFDGQHAAGEVVMYTVAS